MKGSVYQEQAIRTLPDKLPVITDQKLLRLNMASLGLAGESGEVVDEVKKALFHGHPLDEEKLLKELGDICWYLAVASHALDFSLDSIFAENIAKLHRRYPNGFSSEASLNRTE